MKTAVALALALLLPAVARADLRDDDRIAAEVDAAPDVRVRSDVDVRALRGALDAAALDQFAAMAQDGVTNIERFTGVSRDRSQRIVIYLSPRVGISHTFPHYPDSPRHEPRMFIDSKRVADGDAPYLHELVHAVVGDGGATWLEEGFAEYVASSVAQQYGGYYAPVLSDDNTKVDAQARDVVASGGVRAQWFARSEPELRSQHERRNFYIVAHSFTQFLARHLGTRQLVRLHRAGDARAVARTSEQWEGRWLGEMRR